MLSTLLLPLLSTALLSLQVAGSDICNGRRPVCFNSFYRECDRDHIDESGTCTFDSGNSYDYSYPGNNGGHKLIFADQEYKMTWVGDRLGEYPVRLAWYLLESDQMDVGMVAAGNLKNVTWDKSTYM
ncbi:hypothetical protein LIA77_03635 [Sarocladium implicatum]|nr:hypothetical protein LIA77_03635 [Sarocladium implicatum]